MLIFSGDWHGEYDKAYRKMKELDLRDCTIVQVGDFGVGFERPKKDLRLLQRLNDMLAHRNVLLYAIRGNHDDPKYFDGSINMSNLKLLPDYSVIEAYSKKILCIGGAASVDRKPNPEEKNAYGKPWKGRRVGYNYWENETFVLDQTKLDVLDIDIVATHSAPNFCFPLLKGNVEKWFRYDVGLKELCQEERDNHTRVYEILKGKGNNLTHWFYGHFHMEKSEMIDDTKFVLLDINQFYEVRF